MWKPIPDYPDYEANDLGQIRNRETGRVRDPKARDCNGTGYLVLAMPVDGRWVARRVHRLVASAFLGPCPTGMEVNHKNTDRLDNRPTNLEYITHKQNTQHWPSVKTKPDPRATWTKEQVLYILSELAKGRTQSSLATEFGCYQAKISFVARGKRYKWATNPLNPKS